MGESLWFASRAGGLLALVLLTGTFVLGLLTSGRHATVAWPRFTIALLHRNLSLLTVVFLAVHIVTAVVDGYVSIGWIDVVVPFVAGYQPFWLGLGAVAVDVLVALVVTSLLRARIRPEVWRAVHWLAYACWPVALVHGLGMGTDLWWVWVVDAVCLAAVLGALVWRARRTHPDTVARVGVR
ncbi:ferric reductase-like transmembrane domain-containing protein [Umezawaea sp. NPDC059074]|uniref:ferric reductase-like transmembrane domain-containing protein n=1 Tax=Umezawaea sp. NPDC059074 TaxID=3346716 RepID=UPI0036A0648B